MSFRFRHRAASSEGPLRATACELKTWNAITFLTDFRGPASRRRDSWPARASHGERRDEVRGRGTAPCCGNTGVGAAAPQAPSAFPAVRDAASRPPLRAARRRHGGRGGAAPFSRESSPLLPCPCPCGAMAGYWDGPEGEECARRTWLTTRVGVAAGERIGATAAEGTGGRRRRRRRSGARSVTRRYRREPRHRRPLRDRRPRLCWLTPSCVAGLVGTAYRIILQQPNSALAALQMAAADSVTMGKGPGPPSPPGRRWPPPGAGASPSVGRSVYRAALPAEATSAFDFVLGFGWCSSSARLGGRWLF